MTKIWDSHVHLFPEEIYRNWERYAKIDPWFGALTAPSPDGKGAEEAWCNIEESLAAADAAGVEGLVMQGWYWNDPGLETLHNDYMAQAVADHPDRLLGFAAINPTFGERAIAEVQRCAKLGFAGIGELGPGGNGYDFTDPRFLDVVLCAAEEGLPICIHCGEPVGHPYNGRDNTPLEPLVHLIGKHPEATFILAHLGGGLPFYELSPRIRKAMKDNVYYDLAANPLLYSIKSVRLVLEMVGEDRVLYGSDFPLTIYPRKCRTPDFTLFLQDLRENAGLTETQLDAVLGNNLARVLGDKMPGVKGN